jgi:hypothetical protein
MVSSEMVAPATDAGATALLLGSAFGGFAVVCHLVRRSIGQSYLEILEKVAVRPNGNFFGTR